VGAERVEWDALKLATQTLAPYGFTEEALMPAYGLAEATLAVTATPRDQPPRHLVLDGIALADGELRQVPVGDSCATRVVSAGVPCGNVQLPGARSDKLGEIQVRSDSLASGYFGDRERTQERFRDGAVLTGDLGFVCDGHLYPVGRLDDVVSVGGRKVYAREIENAVDGLEGVRRGCSTLIERPEGALNRLAMFVELKTAELDYPSLASQVALLAMTKAAVPLSECVFLTQGSLPKTPSGKIQRHRCRQMADSERFAPLARIDLG
jgi:fatty-acyl-CoA synthase